MKKCIICKTEMKIVKLNNFTISHKKFKIKTHYKCPKCGCNIYDSNIMELINEDYSK